MQKRESPFSSSVGKTLEDDAKTRTNQPSDVSLKENLKPMEVRCNPSESETTMSLCLSSEPKPTHGKKTQIFWKKTPQVILFDPLLVNAAAAPICMMWDPTARQPFLSVAWPMGFFVTTSSCGPSSEQKARQLGWLSRSYIRIVII